MAALISDCERLLVPAAMGDLVDVFARLRTGYRLAITAGAEMDEHEALGVLMDLVEDAKDCPLDVFKEACKAWRNSAERFPPSTYGQLKPIISPIIEKRRNTLLHAHRALAAVRAGNVERPRDAGAVFDMAEARREVLARRNKEQPT